MPSEGLKIGRYQLLQLLGSGGMGEVYLGYDTLVNRQVAIKVIRAEAAPYPDSEATKEVERLFQREVKAIASLDHPHILPLYDYGEDVVQGVSTTYMIMPYRAEGTLMAWLQKRGHLGLLSPSEVAQIVSQAASALHYAHHHHIVHQDIKPSNFLLRNNDENPQQPYLQLSDFGVAKVSASTSNVSQSIRGTPTYMAPEQWSGNALPATDQYALAIMAYELLTGRPPFQGGLGQMMYQHTHTKPLPPSIYNAAIPAELDEVIMIALEKEPEKRFLTIAAFARGFQQAIQHMEGPTPLGTPDTAKLAHHYDQTIASTPLGLPPIPPIPPDSTKSAHHYDHTIASTPASLPSSHLQSSDFDLVPPVYAPPPPMYTTGEPYNPYTPIPPVQVPTTPARQPRSLPLGLTIAMVVLAFIVLAAGGLYIVRAYIDSGSKTPSGVVTPGATATFSNPYTHTGTLVLNDPLVDNSKGNAWLEGTNTLGASCYFSHGAYYGVQPNAGFFHSCMGQTTDFSNFVYEVQITLITGDYEGLVFRVNPGNTDQYYYFSIDQRGNYILRRSTDTNWNHSVILSQGSSPPTAIGLNQTNVLAVVANFGNIDLYVNHQKVVSANDDSLSHGQIGFFVGDESHRAQALFQNVKVWKL